MTEDYTRDARISPAQEVKKLGLGARCAEWLRRHYPAGARAKMIAKDFKVCAASAKLWLSGHAPTSAHLESMAGKWGGAFVLHAYSDAIAAALRRSVDTGHAVHDALNRRRDALAAQFKRQSHDLDQAAAASRGSVAAGAGSARRALGAACRALMARVATRHS